MPKGVGTEATNADAPSVDDSPFGDAAPSTAVEVDEEGEPVGDVTGQEPRGSHDADQPMEEEDGKAAEEQADKDESGPAETQTDEVEGGPAKNETDSTNDLKVVVSVRGGIATIGVQRPSSDPHVESLGAPDMSGLAREVPAVIERARARWEEAPMYPAYVRPAGSTGRSSRRGQGSGQETVDGEAAQQQQTLKLF